MILTKDREILRALEGHTMYRLYRLHHGRVVYWLTPDDSRIVESPDVHRLLRAGFITCVDPQQIKLTPAGKAHLGYRDLVSEFFARVS